jgi:hypothetical protein
MLVLRKTVGDLIVIPSGETAGGMIVYRRLDCKHNQYGESSLCTNFHFPSTINALRSSSG